MVKGRGREEWDGGEKRAGRMERWREEGGKNGMVEGRELGRMERWREEGGKNGMNPL